MAWIRLSDNYNDHPKFKSLSDGAFRLWHQAIGFARTYKTDGVVPTVSLRGLQSYSPKRARELMTAWSTGVSPLWEDVPGTGIKIHDYLEWNPSKDEENERRADSKERMRLLRESRHRKGVAPVDPPLSSQNVTSPVSTNSVLTTVSGSHDVPDRIGSDQGSRSLEEKKKELSPILAAPLGARSKRPIFSGQRFVVFEWMLDDLIRMLGPHTDGFDLDAWFWTLDEQAVKYAMVVPQRDGGQWLQAQTLAEAKRRGLQVGAPAAATLSKRSTNLLAAVAGLSDTR